MIVTINAGSSSIRLAAFRFGDRESEAIAADHFRSPKESPEATLRGFRDRHKLGDVRAVAHRVVHGGARLTESASIDDRVRRDIEALSLLAPLHNPIALAWIDAAAAVFGKDAPQIAVFDTAFYSELPATASHYALPRELSEVHSIRRYGFHGIAHQAMWQDYRSMNPQGARGARVISLQLGSGCSVTAQRDGVALDTSMGFSPLEGLMMATRAGDLDPGVVVFLQRAEGWSPEAVENVLNRESGLLGVSGISSDVSVLLDVEDAAAKLALDIYCYRIRKYIGAYAAVLGGLDVILFGGGVGENVPRIREHVLEGLSYMGVEIDQAANQNARGTHARISTQSSRVDIQVVPVDEGAILASEARRLVG